MRLVLALAAALIALGGCATQQDHVCFLGSTPSLDAPPPRTVMRSVTYSTGCIIVPVVDVSYRLPEGEATAGSLESSGGTARLSLSGVAFEADGSQERQTIEAVFAEPLALPARAVSATVTFRRSAGPGQAIEETTELLDLVELREMGDGRVAGFYEYAHPREGAGRFDAPVAVLGDF